MPQFTLNFAKAHKYLWLWKYDNAPLTAYNKHGMVKTDDWPEWEHNNGGSIPNVLGNCFACETMKFKQKPQPFTCINCPLGNYEGKLCLNGLYKKSITSQKACKEIAMLPWKGQQIFYFYEGIWYNRPNKDVQRGRCLYRD